jgi:protein-disulfide isomerase
MEKNKRKRYVTSESTDNRSPKNSSAKYQTIKERRRQQQTRQRRSMIILLIASVLVIVGLFSFNTIRQSLTPVGDFTRVTPQTWPEPSGRSLGSPAAPIKIDVWEDFQCPMCQRYSQEIEPLIISTYVITGQVYYTFRQFPFIDSGSITKESQQSANASMCAGDQNQFWDYHTLVYANWNGENLGSLSDKKLVAFAESMSLDMAKFKQCFNSNLFKSDITADVQAGKAIGVTGTPSIAINNVILKPGFVPSFEEIKQAVDALLANK